VKHKRGFIRWMIKTVVNGFIEDAVIYSTIIAISIACYVISPEYWAPLTLLTLITLPFISFLFRRK